MPSHIEVAANGLRFAALAEGPVGGPLALCLHGFPDSAWTWRHLLPDLADAGFRAVAPWLRGYAQTEVPSDGSYGLGTLVADTVALHEALGGDERAVLIGHDWGATIAYPAAAFTPDRWARLVTLAVPPSEIMAEVLAEVLLGYEQLKRLFYLFLFQTPLAEMAVGANDLAFLEYLWRDWSPGYDAGEDLQSAKNALRNPANLGAAIGYYRAAYAAPDPAYAAEAAAATAMAPQPTLYLHGERDGCIGVEAAANAGASLSPGSKVEVIPGAGHFLHLERPHIVDNLIVDWVG